MAQMPGEYFSASGRPPAVVKAYRKRVNFIRQAQDERDLRARIGDRTHGFIRFLFPGPSSGSPEAT